MSAFGMTLISKTNAAERLLWAGIAVCGQPTQRQITGIFHRVRSTSSGEKTDKSATNSAAALIGIGSLGVTSRVAHGVAKVRRRLFAGIASFAIGVNPAAWAKSETASTDL